MILNQFNKTNSVENLVTTQILKLESLISRNDSLDLSLISTNFLSIAGSGKLRQPKLNKKELSLCNKTQIFSSLFPMFASWWHKIFIFKLRFFENLLNLQFEISKVYDNGLQIYRDQKIRVCGKDSIPLTEGYSKGFRSAHFDL